MEEKGMFKKLLTGLTFAAACSSAFAGTIRHDLDDSIYTDFGNLSIFDSVGAILFDTAGGGFICSGTVIDSHWVLTAAHCVDESTKMTFYQKEADGSHTAYEATRWFAHENWDPTDTLFAGWDIGLMYIKDALTVTPAEIYRGDDEFLQLANHVGYGATGTGLTGANEPAGSRRGGQNIIDERFSFGGDGAQILFSDFDHPTDPSYNAFDFAGVDFDDLAIEREYSIASGDSGGGLFIEEDNQLFLAGVHSFGVDANNNNIRSDYGDFYGSTRVSSFASWIDSVVVPEPSAFIFTLAGFGALFMRRRTHQKD